MLSRVFITSIPNRFTIDRNILDKPLKRWIKNNVLLQSTIYRTQKFEIKSPKYFVHTKKPIEEYNNVEIQDTERNFKGMEIIEKELETDFDCDGPLWRLKILKLIKKMDQNGTCNEYYFIFTSHHSIGDGRNCYELMLQFLNILGNFLEGVQIDDDDDQIRSVEETPHSLEELVTTYQAQSNYITTPKEVHTQDENIHRLPSNVGNKEATVHTQLVCIFLESLKLSNLMKSLKLRAPKAKLTSLLLTLLCLAYKKTCIEFKAADMTLENVQILVLVSLREKLNLSNLQMGVYSTAIYSKIEGELNEKSVWSIAEIVSENLHEKLKNNEEIEAIKNMPELYSLIMNDFEWCRNRSANFNFSNIGIMKNTNSNAIKIQKHFLGMSCSNNRVSAPLFHAITTIDNSLCWSISYDERAYSQKFVLMLKEEILTLLEKLSN